jgi:hypothetical protein
MFYDHDSHKDEQMRVLEETVFPSAVLSDALERARLLGLENYLHRSGVCGTDRVEQSLWQVSHIWHLRTSNLVLFLMT